MLAVRDVVVEAMNAVGTPARSEDVLVTNGGQQGAGPHGAGIPQRGGCRARRGAHLEVEEKLRERLGGVSVDRGHERLYARLTTEERAAVRDLEAWRGLSGRLQGRYGCKVFYSF
jgi:hypothetical protein